MCSLRPATWEGSRAGPPVSECVSPAAHSSSFRHFHPAYLPLRPLPSIEHVVHICTQGEAEFLDVIGRKVLRVFLLAIHIHLY